MKKSKTETIVGIFILIGLLCVGYLTVKIGNISFFGDNSYSLFARFNSVSGLRVGSPVETLGIEIGRVTDLSIEKENQVAVVELRIKKGITVYDDAIASIKTAGLIGDRYVTIDAGGSGDVLDPGETIIETESPIEIEDLIRKYAFGEIKD